MSIYTSLAEIVAPYNLHDCLCSSESTFSSYHDQLAYRLSNTVNKAKVKMKACVYSLLLPYFIHPSSYVVFSIHPSSIQNIRPRPSMRLS